MYQQLWGYKVEEKLYLGVREQKRLNTTDLEPRLMHEFPRVYIYVSWSLRTATKHPRNTSSFGETVRA
jgi:hypothetical protein